MTAEQLEAARSERMRQNGHGAITLEDVRTWIEETGLCIYLPRSTQAGFTAPTFVEAIAGQRTPDPSPELIASAESLLVRLEADGVAVRLNLGGQPLNSSGDQPDYVVAGWVLPYIYALRGDRDWRRSPQLTGSRQVSQLAVEAAKQMDGPNLTATQIRDALGREVTEAAVLRALHELWKQLRIVPVVPEVGSPALWQPLRQRFQKAIAEGASTSQVTAISVLASIYLQAVIASSMEDVEMFLSPLTSRSKIREVVRGLAATRQVHTTTMGHSPMFYVAGTLPEFPAVPSYQISAVFPPYRGSSYLGLDSDSGVEEYAEASVGSHAGKSYKSNWTNGNSGSNGSNGASGSNGTNGAHAAGNGSHRTNGTNGHNIQHRSASATSPAAVKHEEPASVEQLGQEDVAEKVIDSRHQPIVTRPAAGKPAASAKLSSKSSAKPAPRPRTPRTASSGRGTETVRREGGASRTGQSHASSSDSARASARPGSAKSRSSSRPAPRATAGARSADRNPRTGTVAASSRTTGRTGSGSAASTADRRNGARSAAAPKGSTSGPARNANSAEPKRSSPRPSSSNGSAATSASKRYSFSGQAKQVQSGATQRSTKSGAASAGQARSTGAAKSTQSRATSRPASSRTGSGQSASGSRNSGRTNSGQTSPTRHG